MPIAGRAGGPPRIASPTAISRGPSMSSTDSAPARPTRPVSITAARTDACSECWLGWREIARNLVRVPLRHDRAGPGAILL